MKGEKWVNEWNKRERQTTLQLFIGLWGRQCQKYLPNFFRRSPEKYNEKIYVIIFFLKREFTLFKILFVKIKVILSLIHTNTEQ